jgi:hypothetical protein
VCLAAHEGESSSGLRPESSNFGGLPGIAGGSPADASATRGGARLGARPSCGSRGSGLEAREPGLPSHLTGETVFGAFLRPSASLRRPRARYRGIRERSRRDARARSTLRYGARRARKRSAAARTSPPSIDTHVRGLSCGRRTLRTENRQQRKRDRRHPTAVYFHEIFLLLAE